MALESKFQSDLIKELKVRFPGCIVLKNDANYMQGIPDLLILFKSYWAMLEVKKSYEDSLTPQPNQAYYVELFDSMSFSAFIYPENKEDVLNALQHSFGAGG